MTFTVLASLLPKTGARRGQLLQKARHSNARGQQKVCGLLQCLLEAVTVAVVAVVGVSSPDFLAVELDHDVQRLPGGHGVLVAKHLVHEVLQCLIERVVLCLLVDVLNVGDNV